MNSIVIKNAIMNLINLKLPYKVMKYLAIYNEGHKHLILINLKLPYKVTNYLVIYNEGHKHLILINLKLP
jgi:hypothetical protein